MKKYICEKCYQETFKGEFTGLVREFFEAWFNEDHRYNHDGYVECPSDVIIRYYKELVSKIIGILKDIVNTEEDFIELEKSLKIGIDFYIYKNQRNYINDSPPIFCPYKNQHGGS